MSRLAMITFLSGPDAVDPGYGQPGYGGGYPSQGLPISPGHPSQGLPGGGYPSQGLPGGGHISLLPVFPFDPTLPDQGLPGSQPGPDQGLPSQPGRPTHPIQIVPGAKFVVKWLACQGLILVPDNSLPSTEPTPSPTT